ncbi:MAG: hypothetical protein P8J68_02610 [Arenicellaceae bacterium]|nr:hypothetical protein [Arenicellaceae bacterium]
MINLIGVGPLTTAMRYRLLYKIAALKEIYFVLQWMMRTPITFSTLPPEQYFFRVAAYLMPARLRTG